ncbi:MAG: T9SS type A sorting domain-containing protein [Bacteroidales bacterium]|nr:T9SS type A sorting domain-containing protein [Bacteroidales bacterium]
MMKNRFVIALVALMVSGMTMAQDLKPVIGTGQPAPEMKQQKAAGDWKIQFSTTVTPAFTSPAGITSDGKDLYTVSVAKPMIYRVGFDNKLKDSVSISGLSKSSVTSAYAVGVAYDGHNMYVCNGNAAIYMLDSTLSKVEKTITLPSGTYAGAVAYAPDADNGNGGFYVALVNYGIKLFTREGKLLKTITSTDLGYAAQVWALAYDTISYGGPYLYALERYPQNIIRINPQTGKINAPIHTVGADVTAWANYYSYGMYVQKGVVDSSSATLGVFFMARYHIGYDLSTVNDLPEDGIAVVGSDMEKFHKAGTPKTIHATFRCTGSQPLKSYVFHYLIDNVDYTDTVQGKSYSDYVSGFKLTHSKTYTPAEPDMKINVKLWLSDINGNVDEVSSDTLDFVFETYDKGVQRNVLHEGFTAATCSPCKAGNANLKAIMDANSNWVCIKYQMSWPGNGDPYYTSEGYTRRAYYNVSSVPWLRVDGTIYAGNSGSYTATVLKNEAQKPSFVEMNGSLSYDGAKRYMAEITVKPVKDISGDVRLFAALVESKTVKNIADEYLNQYGPATFAANWDTVFHHVMKKFLTPVSTGTAVTLKEDSVLHFNLSYEFQGNYRLPNNAQDPINLNTEHSVEDFNHIYLVYWLQDYKTMEVFQAGKTEGPLSVAESRSSLADVKVFPNPASDMLQIRSDVEFSAVRIVNMAGQVVRQLSAEGMECSLSVQGLAAGLYILQLQTANGTVNTKVQVR